MVVKQVKEGLTQIGLLPSDSERDLIKRVVGVGGDTVKCCDKNDKVTVNGVPLDEPYINPGDKPSAFEFEVKVPEGRLFMMGDHRSDSADSRFHRTEKFSGTIAEDQVVGRAVVIAWPFGHWRKLEAPDTYASVPDARAGSDIATGASHRLTPDDRYGLIRLPTPAELPLVMGVVGLHRIWGRRRHGLRSGCGDLAVGARSGHEGPEDRPGRSGEPDVEAVADGTTPGSDAVGDDGDGDGGATRAQDPEQPRKKPAPSGRSCRSSSASPWSWRCSSRRSWSRRSRFRRTRCRTRCSRATASSSTS